MTSLLVLALLLLPLLAVLLVRDLRSDGYGRTLPPRPLLGDAQPLPRVR